MCEGGRQCCRVAAAFANGAPRSNLVCFITPTPASRLTLFASASLSLSLCGGGGGPGEQLVSRRDHIMEDGGGLLFLESEQERDEWFRVLRRHAGVSVRKLLPVATRS